MLIHKGFANPIVPGVALALLLSNTRATVLTRRWKRRGDLDLQTEEAPDRLPHSWKERFTNVVPAAVWPHGQYVFYPLSLALVLLTLLGAARLAAQQKQLEQVRQQQRGQVIHLPVE